MRRFFGMQATECVAELKSQRAQRATVIETFASYFQLERRGFDEIKAHAGGLA